MSRRVVAVVLALAVCIGLSSGVQAQTITKDPSRAPNGAYRLDVAHSQILFSIVHMGLTDYNGRFDKLSGTLNFDANQPEKSAVEVTIATNSVDTPSVRLNDELKSPSVFSVDQFPAATFKSVSVVRTGPEAGRITGDLTIRGVTKPVTLDVKFSGGETDPLNDAYALGFRATTTIKRSDFGMTGMVWEPLVGDDIELTIEALFEHERE
jgi:polyisoprenoid-binding protein YceI